MNIRTLGTPAGEVKRIRCAGHSLLEMIIATTLSTLLLSSLFGLYYAAASSAASEESRSAATREARMAASRITRDFRLVGLVATEDMNGDSNDINTDTPGELWSNGVRDDFEYANTYDIVITSDYDNDGFTETLRYYLEDGMVKQEIWEWSRDSVEWSEPMVRTLATNIDHLMFMYFDRDGDPIPEIFEAGGVTLTAGQRIRVTAVEVTLVARSDEIEQGNPEYVHTPDGSYWYDNYRRVIFRFMIRGRNLSLAA